MMSRAIETTDRRVATRLAWCFAVLLAARVLGLISAYFLEEDEAAIAVGAAGLIADHVGNLYRYTVQAGYYRLIEGLDLVLGANIGWIPWIMKGLSAVAGTAIPIAGYFAFREELTTRERWLAVLMLAINPIVWRSSQYGNAAIVSTALATVGLVVLSNRPVRAPLAMALGLVGAAVLVRADAVLLLPAVFLLLYRSRGLNGAIRASAVFGLVMGAIYAGVLTLDPNSDNAVASVSRHMLLTPAPSMFWEYLFWAMSPVPCVLAIWGCRNLVDSRARLLGVLLVWIVPTLLFYFRATTTCRYFLNVAVPLSMAAAVGMSEVQHLARRWMRNSTAWMAVGAFSTAHLFLALGHVLPTVPAEVFYGGTFQTHDGPMPTGALLVRTYLTPGSLLRALPHPSFGARDYPFWEGVAFTRAARILADPAAPRRTVMILTGGGFSMAIRYHLQLEGATYLPAGDSSWGGETWMQLGNSRIMTIALDQPSYRALARFDVADGDLMWVVGDPPFPDATAQAKVPAGLVLAPTPAFDPHVRTFACVAAESGKR